MSMSPAQAVLSRPLAFGVSSQAQSADLRTPDQTPCDRFHPPVFTPDEAFQHARQIRATGRTDDDNARLGCWLILAAGRGHLLAETQVGFWFYNQPLFVKRQEHAVAILERRAATPGQPPDLLAEVELSQLYATGNYGVGSYANGGLGAKWMDKAIAHAQQSGVLEGKTKQEQMDFLLRMAAAGEAAAPLLSKRDAIIFNNSNATTRKVLCSEGFDQYCGEEYGSPYTTRTFAAKRIAASQKPQRCEPDNPTSVLADVAMNRGRSIFEKNELAGPPDVTKQGICWFFVAADQGSAWGQESLGDIYYMSSVENHLEHSMYWYKKAANNGDSRAAARVAQMYMRGEGVAASQKDMKYWADLGHKIQPEEVKTKQPLELAIANIDPPKESISAAKKNGDTLNNALMLLIVGMMSEGDAEKPRSQKDIDDDQSMRIHAAEVSCSGGNSMACGQINREPPQPPQ